MAQDANSVLWIYSTQAFSVVCPVTAAGRCQGYSPSVSWTYLVSTKISGLTPLWLRMLIPSFEYTVPMLFRLFVLFPQQKYVRASAPLFSNSNSILLRYQGYAPRIRDTDLSLQWFSTKAHLVSFRSSKISGLPPFCIQIPNLCN